MDQLRLATPRLVLRHFTEADLVPFMAYRNDPIVARYQSWEGITEAQARAFIREQQAAQPGVPGQWLQIALERRDTGELIGDCALKMDAGEPRQAELGYTLARAHQGYGFASEAVRRVLEYAFGELAVHRVSAITDCRNAASVALLERLGWRREGHFLQNVWFKGAWGDEYLYALLRDEWLHQSHPVRPIEGHESHPGVAVLGPQSMRPQESSHARSRPPAQYDVLR